ncbi:hypothetical protein I4U23_012038 [Adineta vaga]|nr:hypothetical protein I4U23_012038 [Adineta vaga]
MTCVVRQLSVDIPTENYPRKFLRAATFDSIIPSMSCRKRLLSEQNESSDEMMKFPHDDNIYSTKRRKIESLGNDSNNKNKNRNIHQCHMHFISSLENIKHSLDLPRDQHRDINSLSFRPFISNRDSSTTNENMLICQQTSVVDKTNENDEEEKSTLSIFLTSAQVSAYVAAIINHSQKRILIIDCGSPLRHNERRMKESFLLNINDKISRKRLTTRGLKNFLDQKQLDRFNQSEIIILYDDSISSSCSNSIIQPKLSSTIKCIYDEIQRFDNNKTIYILQTSFDEFYQQYPTYCYVSSTNILPADHLSPSPTIDIHSYEMSEILPGLYLGNACDAEDRSLLKRNEIQSIINISTTIPCYYENESSLDYLQLKCQDSAQENILQYFDKTFEYIHKKLLSNENILVHCQGGISRSSSFIIGYLMKYHSKTFNQAYLFVKEKRKIVNPNLNFLAQLTRYEQLIATSKLL